MSSFVCVSFIKWTICFVFSAFEQRAVRMAQSRNSEVGHLGSAQSERVMQYTLDHLFQTLLECFKAVIAEAMH